VRAHTWRVAALLFGSGCCALIYQIAWLREFRLIFGASTAASAAVLAIFLGGLGAGGLLLGGRADRSPRPILFYSQLEAIVALSAAVSPFLLTLAREVYFAIGGTPRLGLVGGTIIRLVLSALVLAIPTIVMGGTLPAAARGVTRQTDARRQDVAALYALNTLGAVTGCVIATFFMLEIFGTRMTLWLAALINLLIAVQARQVDRWAPALDAPTTEVARDFSPGQIITGPPAPVRFVLMASCIVGFAFFLMELVWYRMLGPLLGGSVFTFGLILAIALAGIGAGGLLYALVGANRPASLAGFAISCLLEAAAIAFAYALGDRLAVLMLTLVPLGQVGFGAQIASWMLLTTIVVLPAALVAGYQFPMLIALLGRGREHVGRQIGLAYAANTLGAIAGSLAGGFGLLPWLSAAGAWRLVALSLVVLGAGAATLALMNGVRRGLVAATALAVATLLLLTAAGPTAVWRHSGIGAGRARLEMNSPNQLREWMHTVRRQIAWDGDGTESSVALSVDSFSYSLIVNGKSDGNARRDAGTQVMLGLIGAILQPQARRSLVIGLGTGSTAGWLGVIDTMERVDVVELEPLVLEVARACSPVNWDVLRNPKVHITIGDARETLLTGTDEYDIIASEPSNPYRAGVASLFTREYYEAARDRLSADGLFAQWVQAYEVDARTLRTVYATMGAVFPHVETWQTTSGDLVLVGARQPIPYRANALTARIAQEPFKSALLGSWRAIDLNGFLAHYLAGDRLTRALAGSAGTNLNTDDRNVVEFGFARSVGRGGNIIAQVRELARNIGVARAPLDDPARGNWEAVDTAWIGFQAFEGFSFDVPLQGSAGERGRQAALLNYYRSSDLAAARRTWPEQPRAPLDPTELAMLADIEATAGSDAALPYIEQLRVYQPGEADAMLAELRVRQSRDAEAVAALASAFRRFRTDPWPLTRFKRKAVLLANALAARNPATAPPLFDALREPFAVRAADQDRLTTSAALTQRMDFKARCAAAVGALEPHVPWTGPFLKLRHDCYQAAGDPRLDIARRDLSDFFAREPLPLGAGVRVQ
jgi:spermidine synthase